MEQKDWNYSGFEWVDGVALSLGRDGEFAMGDLCAPAVPDKPTFFVLAVKIQDPDPSADAHRILAAMAYPSRDQMRRLRDRLIAALDATANDAPTRAQGED